MDLVGLAASIVNVSDFSAKLTRLVANIITDIHEIPEYLRHYSQAIANLGTLLRSIQIIAQDPDLDPSEEHLIAVVIDISAHCAELLDKVARDLPSLQSDATFLDRARGAFQKSIHARTIADNDKFISRYIEILQFTLTILNSCAPFPSARSHPPKLRLPTYLMHLMTDVSCHAGPASRGFRLTTAVYGPESTPLMPYPRIPVCWKTKTTTE